jgi:hypothetical protein
LQGGKAHRKLILETQQEYLEKGYTVVLDGDRKKQYHGLPRVDLIAEKDNEVYLIECGWISELSRFSQLREANKLPYFLGKRIKIIWLPYVDIIQQQKTVLKR